MLNSPGRKQNQNIFEDVEAEQKREKLFKQQMAAKRFSKERFYKTRFERKKTADLIDLSQANQKKILTRKEKYELLKKEYNQQDLESLLIAEGCDFNNPDLNIQWLPLHYYDDYQMEQIFIDDNIDFNGIYTDEKGNKLEATGQALWRIDDQHEYKWFPVQILGYVESKQKFKCLFENGEKKLVPRIYICLDIEDPQKFALRMSAAFQRRLYADSLIRYKFYIAAMPTEHLSEVSVETKKNLERLVRNKKLEHAEVTALLMEVSQEYAYNQNGIIFEKYLAESTGDLVPHGLVLPPKPEDLGQEGEVPYFGMLELEAKKGAKDMQMYNPYEIMKSDPKDFTELFKEFCLQSFFITPEAITVVRELVRECNNIQDYQFFSLTVPSYPYRLEEFKQEQDSFEHATMTKLKQGWVPNIEKLIATEFQKSDKGWTNLKESSIQAYESGKLKKFMKLVTQRMQDTLLSVSQKSFKNFQEFVGQFVPQTVTIKDASDIVNQFRNGVVLNSKDPESFFSPHAVKPLFLVEVLKNIEEESFYYSTTPKAFVQNIQMVFDKVLDDLSKIPLVEKTMMHDLFRKNGIIKELTLKSPRRHKQEEVGFVSANNLEWDENKWITDLFAVVMADAQKSIEPLAEYIKCFEVYKGILKMNPEEYVKAIEKDENNQRDVESLRDEIRENYKKEKTLLNSMPDTVQVSCFLIKCKETIQYLASKYQQMGKLLTELIAQRARLMTNDLFQQINAIKDKIKEKPNNIEKLTEIQEFMGVVPNDLEKIKVDIEKSMDIYLIMDEFQFHFPEEDIKRKWQVFGGPKDVLKMIDEQKVILEKEKIKFRDKMENEQVEFKQDLEDAERTIMNFSQYTNIKDHATVSDIASELQEKLKEFQERARKYNLQEALFEREMTDYSKINQLIKEFSPYSNMWITSNRWFKNIEGWNNGPWNSLDAPACEKFVEDAVKTFNQVINFFKQRQITAVLKIAENVKSQIDTFRPKVPLMVALRKQGMKERHWNQISDKVGFKVDPTAEQADGSDFTFTKLLNLGLMENLELCCDVGERASKEFHIETELGKMKKAWEDINFLLSSYKNGLTFIIKGFDDINNTLDEHIVQTQAMLFSPFKKPFEEEINEWSNQLKLMSDILDEWAKYQVHWMYLQPIFDSPDIAKQLPGEYKKFKTVDNNWKQTMIQTKQIMNVLKVTQMEGLLDKLKEGNTNLDIIQKELNNYLARKRERFARFYFLSDDELLEILSQTKEPTAVQPHLRKVFENVHSLEFDAQKKMHAMFSAEQEKVKFVRYVDPLHKNVEDWMNEVEEQMRLSVRAALLNSIQDYSKRKRTEWVISHPGQCVLNGSQTVWTQEVETSIKENKVKVYWEGLNAQLNDLVDLVRQKLSKQAKVTVNALIVLDVHAKDVVEKLWRNDVVDIGAFEWISQLRYYWENDNLYTKCVQTNFPYGYEYLGNTLRLVITPLTDKCYMTLMGALKLNLGGAPAGPAGTGKTESTKDLAKALAKQCVVFNCSDQMDYIMVGKFFKGLASAGAWCCFDEFNRINIEVLSVIAQQLLILFTEKAKGSTKVENFEGSDIVLQPTFSVFITMNPGYAGRTELPDNLKALFRGVAMMVPDYALIGEIMLYSFGFRLGRDLAKKMVVTFKLASEQLSSQDHYDYGMRAVRSVINAAGLLKAAEPDMNEEQLLLRALRDVNVPKFLKDDIPLFENIIKDLFPGIEKPKIDYGNLLESINNACNVFNLQSVDTFVQKVLQLYDTQQVRHGMMLVGPTGGGKTSNYKVLQRALSDLNNKGFYKVFSHIMNPKSIMLGQLYGQFNEVSREWNDGILAYTVREACKDQSSDRHWIIFDGPVDAIWIESMNTVLDDNKKLCLNSGQILTLTPYMTMMFEVEDLLVASPATVSRCGMVYLEPVSMGLQPLIKSWLNSIPPQIAALKTVVSNLTDLFQKYIDPCVEFLRKSTRETVTTMDNNICQSLTRIMNCFFNNYKETEVKKVSPEELQLLESNIESLFIFSLIWSICCTCDYDGRKKFDQFLRMHMANLKSKVVLPSESQPTEEKQVVQKYSIYDFQFIEKTKQFVPWSELNRNFEIDQKLQYNEIMVPTNDSTRNIFMMRLLLTNKYHVLFPGLTGTGKSLNANTLLSKGLTEDYQYISLMFSAQTSANQTQDSIDSKLEKRRRGIYGPPVGKRCIIFVDDLNMPKKEEYGAQPPIELLRQYLDHKGWYNRKDLQFMTLEDIILLSAMGPPGGGRSSITARIMRHFNIISYTELDEGIIKEIFKQIVTSFLIRFPEAVRALTPQLIDTVLIIFNRVKQELLPTPKKSHYTFNLRDISKVFQGICAASQKYCTDVPAFLRLWYHENMRIYHDRLIDEEDRTSFKQMLAEVATNNFCNNLNLKIEDVLNIERVIFGDFLQGRDMEPRHYFQVADLKEFIKKMDEFQEDYNQDPSFAGVSGKNAMKLVLFLDACEHIARISRVLRQPSGNALLLGVGGSGRQSLSKMATFIANYKLFQIEVVKGYNMRSWREDVKNVLMKAGVEQQAVTFLFVDTQIINEQQVEDLNNVLNSGDVTGIYQEKDMEEIVKACKTDCIKKNLQPNKMNIYAQYLIRVKSNIHLVMAMSPLSSMFQTRLRMFPSLVNCCTLDWFTEWPEEALLGVGKGQLMDFSQEVGIESEQLSALVEAFKTMHKSVEKISIAYKSELRRTNFVTPTSYLELLTMFKTIMKQKRQELKQSITRLKTGLDRLIEANTQVAEMQVQLKEMQPQLQAASIETDKMMAKIEVDKKEADETQKIVSAEEAIATKQAEEAQALKREAEDSVREANMKLEKTLEEVKLLKKDHLVEVKSLKTPPKACIIILGAMCILMQDELAKRGQKGIIMRNVEGQIGKKEEDYFKTAAILLNDPVALLDLLKTYDREHINQNYIVQLKAKILPCEDFTLDRANQCSYAISFIYKWCMAMYDFNTVFKETQPLRDKLAEQEKILSEKMAELAVKKKALQDVNDKIAHLEATYRAKLAEKEKLENDIKMCELKLDRAQKLTGGLSDEKVRWGHDVGVLQSREPLILGDSIIGAGMVAYSGPFTAQYRQTLEQTWVKKLDEIQIPHTENVTMSKFLGEPVKIQAWNIAGLPKDDCSIENGIIIDKSRRWPLMIDPQTQANKYIKNMGKDWEEGIDVVKQSDPKLMQTLEIAIQHGKWVLVENVGKELDPSLEPILLQQVVKSGSSLSIQIGDKTLSYDPHFHFFMTTTIPNPSYSPETFVKVCIINFAITPQGLEDQMLAQIVALENQQLEQKKVEIVKRNAQDKKDLLDIENKILKSLQSADSIEGLLMDETLINTLQNAKRFAAEINQRMKDSKVTEEQIDKAREGYRPVAFRASLLFFCIVDLNGIDPMYEYSLQWFIKLFNICVEKAPDSKELDQRLENLNVTFTYSLYENVCRSLFERHKLLFSFLLTVKILQGDGKMVNEEWRYLLAGPSGEIKIPKNFTTWVSENGWADFYRQVYGMSNSLKAFNGFLEEFEKNPDMWQPLFDSPSPHTLELPERWQNSLSGFQRIIMLKAIRPDKVIPAVELWIEKMRGREFIIPPVFNLQKCFSDSSMSTPLIFVLSPGSDPVADFKRFAQEMDMSKRQESISLGQGQGQKAERMTREASQRGGWVLLQNCHLAISWMPELERICEEFNEGLHVDFRLWLTSMPSASFPISVLQNSVKMTLEPPQGLRSNLKRSYVALDDNFLKNCAKPEQFKKLTFAFCFFHAIVQDRRKFGPIGWNIPYEFTMEDLDVCLKQLKMLLDEYEQIPYKVLNYIGAEINYGGRVTDDKDVRLIKAIMQVYMNQNMLEDNFKLSESGIYYSPPAGEQQDYITYIDSLPLNPQPEVFGLHDNADITNAQNQTRIMLENILSVQPRTSSQGGKQREEIIEEIATYVQSRTPPVYDFDDIFRRYPTDYNESMNTVLVQEVVRYNRLLSVMKESLVNVKKALKGQVVMSEELEKLANSLFDNQVPKLWADKGFLSLKPLASWTQDLNDRIKFLSDWIDKGTPVVFWFSGFFFPQAFITGTLQNYARKKIIAIDKLSFEFIVVDDLQYTDIKEKPEAGCYVYGIFLEGARWDSQTHLLTSSRPKELFSTLPMMKLLPVSDRATPTSGIYQCPLYKVVSRAGTLSTTGHSTNFVMFLELSSDKTEDAWVVAGVAAFLALRY